MTNVFILNLERSVDRRDVMIKQFNAIDHSDYHFFPAYDSKYMSNLTLNANIGIGYGSGRPFQKAELGIIMSHLAAIKTAKMMGLEEVIVLEDDVVICEDWKERLETLKQKLPTDWEYCYLSGHSDYVKFNVYNTATVVPAPKMIGAFSYLVNHTAYNKIINYCTSFMTTFDDMIMHMIDQKKLNAFTYFPFMTYHAAKESYIWGVTSQEHSSRQFFKNKI